MIRISIISSNCTHGQIRIVKNRKLHRILLIRIYPTKLTNLELLLWTHLLWYNILWIGWIAKLIGSDWSWIIFHAANFWLIPLFGMILCFTIFYALMKCGLLISFYIGWCFFDHQFSFKIILTIRMMMLILSRRNGAFNLFIIMYYSISINHKVCSLWLLFKVILLMDIFYYLFVFTLNIFDLFL